MHHRGYPTNPHSHPTNMPPSQIHGHPANMPPSQTHGHPTNMSSSHAHGHPANIPSSHAHSHTTNIHSVSHAHSHPTNTYAYSPYNSTPYFYTSGRPRYSYISGGVVSVLLFLLFGGIILSAITSTTTLKAAVSAGSSAFFSAATLGFGALIAYSCIGIACLYSAAKEAYMTDRSPLEIMIKNINYSSTLTVIGIILWSPFILLGSAAGKAVQAATKYFSRRNTPQVEYIPLDEFPPAVKNPLNQLGHGDHKDTTMDQPPTQEKHSMRIFSTYKKAEEPEFPPPTFNPSAGTH